ncbi:MAG: hypothetical protein IPH87_16465 [Anaerolineae bacterium]|nr:hypothetical protein [Anaerolineae bacterium]
MTAIASRRTTAFPHRLLPLFAPLLTDIRRSANLLERALTIPDLALKLHMVSTATGLPLRQVVALPLQVNQDLLGLIIVRSGGAAFSANDRQVLRILRIRLPLPYAMRGFTRRSTTNGAAWTRSFRTAPTG